LGASTAALDDPLPQPDLDRRGLEHAAHQVGGDQPPASLGREDELVVGSRGAQVPELLRHPLAEADGTRLVALRLAELAAVELPRDAQPIETDVAPADLDRLANSETGLEEEVEEESPVRAELVEQTCQFIWLQHLDRLAVVIATTTDPHTQGGVRGQAV